ncbi:MAG: hypothetical protein U0V74_07720 [Chitinophagales bacterium]
MRKPSFTLEQWVNIFKGIDTLEEYAAFEEMFRTDCLLALWEIHQWSRVLAVARSRYHEITRAVFK